MMNGSNLRKILLILEIVGLFIVSTLLARQIGSWLGIRSWLLEANAISGRYPVDFVGLASRTAIGSTIKYTTIFLLVVLFLIMIRSGYKFRSVGLSVDRRSPRYLLKVTLFIFCLGGVIPKFLFFLWPTGLVGAGPETWQLLHQPWGIDFWIFMLAGSIVLPPLFEELFFRGYTQSRLECRFSAGPAIVIMALIFSLFHTQYFQGSVIAIGMMISLFLSSLILGYARHRTGTIVPGIVAHALVNIPVIGTPALILALLMLVFLFINRKQVIRHSVLFLALVGLGRKPDSL